MKKFFLITFFTLLLTSKIYAADDVISAQGPDITFEDAKHAAKHYSFKRSITTSSEYYDQLTNNEQDYYNFLENNIDRFMAGTETVTYSLNFTISPDLSAKEEIFNEALNYIGIDISTFIYRPIYALTYMDKPQYFWLDINKMSASYGYTAYYPSTGNINFVISLSPKDSIGSYLPSCYTSLDEITADYTAMMNKANEIVSNLPPNSTDWGKLNYFMCWLQDNCHYNSSSTDTQMQFLPTSALLYGTTTDNAPVCEGYSEALKILCNLSGIESMCTESLYELDGAMTGHKWNLVNINNKYYHCDPTWFDSGLNTIYNYNFLFVGAENMAKYDSSLNHTICYQLDFTAPLISASDYLNDIGINSFNILDIDGNNIINKSDNALLLKIISGINSSRGNDINNDGNININDVIKIQSLMFTK